MTWIINQGSLVTDLWLLYQGRVSWSLSCWPSQRTRADLVNNGNGNDGRKLLDPIWYNLLIDESSHLNMIRKERVELDFFPSSQLHLSLIIPNLQIKLTRDAVRWQHSVKVNNNKKQIS